MKLILATIFIAFLTTQIFGQDVPQIIDFQRTEHGEEHQNWMISQGCNGYIYSANSAGVLIFNGMDWQIVKMPNNLKPRSVYIGSDCRIYSGGFEYFGYIDISDISKPHFINLADSILSESNQEIWNIIGLNDNIIFQSFSNLYTLKNDKIEAISVPSNIMLGNSVNGNIYIPKIENGLYQLIDQNLKTLKGSDHLPDNSKIAGITSLSSSKNLLIATQFKGLFILDKELSEVKNKLNDKLKKEQINKIITLSNGDIAIGTILNGLYITDSKLNFKHHINKENGLANNTVLSLFQDNNSDLWVGLDKGINLIKLSSSNRFFYDRKGKLGTVFTSMRYKNRLYLGTNQGLFRQKEDGTFQLIENSQGQIWSLLSIKGDLLIGHNNGTFQLIDDKAIKISTVTGGWDMRQLPDGNVLQSAYNGLVVLNKINNKWQIKHKLKMGSIQMSNFSLEGTQLIGKYPTYGLCILQLSEDYTEVLSEQKLESIDGTVINNNVILNLDGEPQGFTLNNIVYEVRSNQLPRRIKDEAKPQFKNTIDFIKTIGDIQNQYPTTNTNYINRSSNEKMYIIGVDEGFIKVAKRPIEQQAIIPSIEYIMANESIKSDFNTPFRPNENYIQVQLQDTTLSRSNKTKLKYQLEGWDLKQYPLPKDGKIVFRNLDNGKYIFSIQDTKLIKHKLLEFEIAPHWYESWRGGILYISLILFSLWMFYKINKRRHLAQQAELIKKQEKELESTKIRARNETLENKILYKSKMLANSTITLVQKNKMLAEMRDLIQNQDTNTSNFNQLKQKLYKLIDRNINNDENWEIFERNFAAVHENFLDNLKSTCPNITTGELKLAAYIKMNLGSKEIAPLLNISVRSIENKRYRLRKKLGINHETTLKEHLLSL